MGLMSTSRGSSFHSRSGRPLACHLLRRSCKQASEPSCWCSHSDNRPHHGRVWMGCQSHGGHQSRLMDDRSPHSSCARAPRPAPRRPCPQTPRSPAPPLGGWRCHSPAPYPLQGRGAAACVSHCGSHTHRRQASSLIGVWRLVPWPSTVSPAGMGQGGASCRGSQWELAVMQPSTMVS